MEQQKGLDVNDAVNYNIDMDSTITITGQGRYWAFVTVGKQCEVVDTMIVALSWKQTIEFLTTLHFAREIHWVA